MASAAEAPKLSRTTADEVVDRGDEGEVPLETALDPGCGRRRVQIARELRVADGVPAT
jgi:hypothetical protein